MKQPATETLYQAAKELTNLYPRLSALVLETHTNPIDHDTKTPHKRAYLEPWNTPAGELKHDIHTQARRYETALNIALFNKATYRGASDELTIAAFNRLAVLIDHAHAQNHASLDVTDAAKLLTTWPRKIRLALDEPLPGEEPWTKAPGNLLCPHCDNRLELQPGWKDHPDTADVICRHCKDDNGEWLRWKPDTWVGILQDA
ncbi:hypothetical protein ACFSYH_02000 [Populibacterium corticicola]|uniref:Uncharacterized protein n=1 Tax=Populibacterium corticicola TaxID=1812826 RepID=A0ABW5XC81_9MICO